MRRRLPIVVLVAVAVVGPFALGYSRSRADRATRPLVLPVVDQVREALAGGYYRPLSPRVLNLSSVDAMLSALHDPYTAYLDPPAYRLARAATASTYTGIGVSVLPTPAGLVVVDVRSGPASRAGVQVGDTIVAIDNADATRLGMAAAVARIDGRRGTTIQLELRRRGGHRATVLLRRELVREPVVTSRLLAFGDHRYGDIRVDAFRAGAAQQLARQLRLLEEEHVHGLVLDLRDDPGGLVYQAVAVSSLFLDRGVVVRLSGAHGTHETLVATGHPLTRLPLVVLVDRYTASSAEIVAGALRDNHRATVVGERTFGKAVVQLLDPLANGAALELTVARYFTPGGEDISHIGITPEIRARDLPATSRDEALTAALRVLAEPTS